MMRESIEKPKKNTTHVCKSRVAPRLNQPHVTVVCSVVQVLNQQHSTIMTLLLPAGKNRDIFY